VLAISPRVEGVDYMDEAARRDGYLSVSDSCPKPLIEDAV